RGASAGRARLGQRITFAVKDETHSWLDGNGGWRLGETQRRHPSRTGRRPGQTPNAWAPRQRRAAARTPEAAARGQSLHHAEPLHPAAAGAPGPATPLTAALAAPGGPAPLSA
ncbi:hypothetical protein CLM82_23255, partial [Streptomyces albidoflavus]